MHIPYAEACEGLQLLQKENLPAWDTAQATSLPTPPDESGNLHIPVPSRSDIGDLISLRKIQRVQKSCNCHVKLTLASKGSQQHWVHPLSLICTI